jgi:anaphase-promoting complex subunit 2
LPKLDATIASRLYWPSLPSAQQRPLALPPAVKAAMRAYARRFSHLKAPRRLKWRPALGLVELEVQPSGPDSAPLTFRVTPAHAALLLALDESGAPEAGDGRPPLSPGPVAASALAERLGAPAGVVRQKALFWVNAGVLSERRVDGEVVYERVRGGGGGGGGAGAGAAAGSGGSGAAPANAATDASPSSYEATDLTWADPGAAGGSASGGASSAEARLRAEVGPFEGYVIGLLTNMGGGQGLSLDRLHGLLRLFCVGEPKYDGRVTQEQLGAYLGLMAAKGSVVAERGGVYRRPGAGGGGGGGGGGAAS